MDKKPIKNIFVFASPLLLFVVLLIPYCWLNQQFIIEWFGCGCNPGFNANDFTAVFWSFVSVCATGVSFFLSRRIPKERMLFRVAYMISVLVLSLLISSRFSQMMMWK